MPSRQETVPSADVIVIKDAVNVDWTRHQFPLGVRSFMDQTPVANCLSEYELEVLAKLLTKSIGGVCATEECPGLRPLAAWAQDALKCVRRKNGDSKQDILSGATTP